MKTVFAAFFLLSLAKGAPLTENEVERDEMINDFLRSDNIFICYQNIFLPGSVSEGNGDSNSRSDRDNEGGFQQCIQEAFSSFSEGRRSKVKRSPPDNEESQGGGSGSSGSNQNQVEQCVQNAITFPGSGSIPGSASIPFFGGGSRSRRSDSGNSGSSGSGSLPFNIDYTQIQQCMQNSVPGRSKRSASDGEDAASGATEGSGSNEGSNSNQNQVQQCVQNAITFPGSGSIPGSASIPFFGGGSRSRRSDSGNSGSSGSGSLPFNIDYNQIQQCMQNSVPGRSKRSASDGGDAASGATEGSGSNEGSTSNQNQVQQCVQNAITFPGSGSIPGSASIPFFGGGSRSRRSDSGNSGSSGSGSGGSLPFNIDYNQIQQCMTNSVPGRSRRSPSDGEDAASGATEGSGSNEGSTSNQNQVQQCVQNAITFPGSGSIPGSASIPFFGGGSRARRSDSGNSGSSGSGSGGSLPFNIDYNQIQQCMTNSVPGRSRRSASDGEDAVSGATEGSGSNEGSTSNQNQVQQCVQNAITFPGSGSIPGSASIPFFGGGSRSRRSDSGNSGSGGSGSLPFNIDYNQIQQCMQNSVPGAGSHSKRSVTLGTQEVRSPLKWSYDTYSKLT